MNKTASAGKVFIVFIIFGLLALSIFLLFGSKISMTKGIYDKVFNGKGEEIVQAVSVIDNNMGKNIIIPPSSIEWCKIQNITVKTGDEEPRTDKILGYDTIYECCVRAVEGFNCALDVDTEIRMCFTGNVGGIIKWVSVNGFFTDNVMNYNSYVSNLDKFKVPNKPLCDDTLYPSILQINDEEEVY